MKPITQKQLKSVMNYDAKTGLFTWKVPRKGVRVGAVAGGDDGEGYVRIKVCQRYYRASRLAWLFVHGQWPTYEIDHRNGKRADNRISNLRDIPCLHNHQNIRKPHRDTSNPYLGISFDKRNPAWCAGIKANGKAIHLGQFKTPLAAHRAYLKAKRELHPGCTI